MITSPVYQKVDVEKGDEITKLQLVKLAHLREKVASSHEDKELLESNLGKAERHIKEAEQSLSNVGDFLSSDVDSPQSIMKGIREKYIGDIQAALNTVENDLKENESNLAKYTDVLGNKGLLRTESFELAYHNKAFGEISNLWKSEDEFYDFIEGMVNEFNEDIGHRAIVVKGYLDETTVHFLFSKSDLEAVEGFIPKMANAIRTDYEKNYVSEENRHYWENPDCTDHPFSLEGMTQKNHFYFYSQHEMANATRSEWLEAGKSVYGIPSESNKLMAYQSLQPHFVLPVNDEVGRQITEWKDSSFGMSVQGINVPRSRQGFDMIARISQQRVLAINPELVAKLESKDIENKNELSGHQP